MKRLNRISKRINNPNKKYFNKTAGTENFNDEQLAMYKKLTNPHTCGLTGEEAEEIIQNGYTIVKSYSDVADIVIERMGGLNNEILKKYFNYNRFVQDYAYEYYTVVTLPDGTFLMSEY